MVIPGTIILRNTTRTGVVQNRCRNYVEISHPESREAWHIRGFSIGESTWMQQLYLVPVVVVYNETMMFTMLGRSAKIISTKMTANMVSRPAFAYRAMAGTAQSETSAV